LGGEIGRNGRNLLVRVALGELVHDGGGRNTVCFVIQHFSDHVILVGPRQRDHARLGAAIGAMAGGARSRQTAGLQRINLGLRQTRESEPGGRCQKEFHLHGVSLKKQWMAGT